MLAPFWLTENESFRVSRLPCSTKARRSPRSKVWLQNGALHPMQAAFVEQDGFQCGYCTPGQICSAIGMIQEIPKRFAERGDGRRFRPVHGVFG